MRGGSRAAAAGAAAGLIAKRRQPRRRRRVACTPAGAIAGRPDRPAIAGNMPRGRMPTAHPAWPRTPPSQSPSGIVRLRVIASTADGAGHSRRHPPAESGRAALSTGGRRGCCAARYCCSACADVARDIDDVAGRTRASIHRRLSTDADSRRWTGALQPEELDRRAILARIWWAGGTRRCRRARSSGQPRNADAQCDRQRRADIRCAEQPQHVRLDFLRQVAR